MHFGMVGVEGLGTQACALVIAVRFMSPTLTFNFIDVGACSSVALEC
jgi:hypothetical protein